MGTFNNLAEAQEYFKNDRYAVMSGITLTALTEDSCRAEMPLRDLHRNALGGVMGGAIYTLADFAFAVIANQDHNPTVAADVTVNFLSGSRGTKLVAEASRVKCGKTTAVYQVMVTDDLGRDIALFTGTGYHL